MNIVVTGSAGFFGNYVTKHLIQQGNRVIGLDNLSRKGSKQNADWQSIDYRMKFHICDISDKAKLEECLKGEEIDWIIDCAAEPSVLAGVDGGTENLINSNLISTINLLEICRKTNAGFILMSTSRVYSVNELANLEKFEADTRFETHHTNHISEWFSTKPPVSLYGSTKLTSELLSIEYSQQFRFPLWINRCGVIAGAGQFGKIDQGIFSYWIYSWIRNTPLKYIGFGGNGKQVRDVIHPKDICKVMDLQLADRTIEESPIYNLGGGRENSMSLLELTEWCNKNIENQDLVQSSPEIRPFDIPIYITNYEKAKNRWNFNPSYSMNEILQEIYEYTKENPGFLNRLYN